MNKNLIYISGYGRSGSTILEIALSKYFEVFPSGELSNIFNFYFKNGLCECGKEITECSFWSSILESNKREVSKSKHRITRMAESPFLCKVYEGEWKNIWNPIMTKLFDNTNDSIIVDSSKSTRGSFYRQDLLRSIEVQVNEIFLIRNPVDVMKSTKKGSNKNLENGDDNPVLFGGAIRTGLSWLLTNFLVNKRFDKSKGIILTYEEFVENTEGTMEKIKDRFQLESRVDNSINHGISGNRLRRNNKELEIKKSKSDITLNSFEKVLASFLVRYYYFII